MQSRLIGNDFLVSKAEIAGGQLCQSKLLRSFLDFNTLGDTARQCLQDTGQTAVVTGGNCAACRAGELLPDGRSRCGACARDLGGAAECFNGNIVN